MFRKEMWKNTLHYLTLPVYGILLSYIFFEIASLIPSLSKPGWDFDMTMHFLLPTILFYFPISIIHLMATKSPERRRVIFWVNYIMIAIILLSFELFKYLSNILESLVSFPHFITSLLYWFFMGKFYDFRKLNHSIYLHGFHCFCLLRVIYRTI